MAGGAARQATREIPGDGGLPGVGHSVDFVRDPVAFIQNRMARYGPVSWCELFGMRTVVLLGPEANEWLLKDRGGVLSNEQGWAFFIGELFSGGLMLRDGGEHRSHRRIMQVAFRRSAMAGYIEAMNPTITQVMDSWETEAPVAIYPAMKDLTLRLASRVFLGLALGEEADRINQAFVDAVQASMSWVRYPVPGLAYHRGIRGRAVLADFFRSRIAEKRAGDGADMFSHLCQAVTPEGDRFDDQDIVDHLIFLMMAAHDTTTATLTMACYELARHPDWQERVREEGQAIRAGELAYDDMEGLRVTDQVMREVLRLYPPVATMPRKTTASCTYDGYLIEAETIVAITPAFTHRMPEHWPAPDVFDPTRFANEGHKHAGHPYAWIPFGGGAHVCIGLHFAAVQVQAVLHALLSRYELSVPSDYATGVVWIPMLRPEDDLPIRLRAR